jgi:diguanylate cyclase
MNPAMELTDLTARATELLDRSPQDAAEVARRAVQLAEESCDESTLAEALYLLGSALVLDGQYEEAEGRLRRSLDLARSTAAHATAIRCLRRLLQCAFFVRNTDAALLRGLQALQLAREFGDRGAEGLTHNDLGLVYGNLGDFEGALEHLLAGLRLLRQEGSPGIASLLNNIGNVYLEVRDFRQALASFEAGLEAFRADGRAQGEAIAYGNVGRALSALGRPDEAIEAFRRSLAIFEGTPDRIYRAPALARLGTELGRQGRKEEAERAFAEALAALERAPAREFEDEVLTAVARTAIDRGEVERAIPHLRRLLDLIPRDEITRRAYETHESLSEALERSGDLEEALHHHREFHRIRLALADSAAAVHVRGLMLRFEVEQARQQEEIFRLRSVELADANAELHRVRAQLEAQNEELLRISIEDPLTGLRNRRFLDLQLAVELQRARRHGRALTVAVCDIDQFKSVNDTYSHGVGDEVLRRVADILARATRGTDLVGRLGGDEFLLALPDTDLAGGKRVATRIVESMAAGGWEGIREGLRVTLSIGLAAFTGEEDGPAIIDSADKTLYRAKSEGRARVAWEDGAG